jgi:sugar phosphate permease
VQLPAGLLSDSWGPRNTISVFFCVAFLGALVLGLAPSASWAIFGRTLVGLGVAMLFVPTMKILAEWFRQKEFAMMTGILMAMGGIGSLTAATPLALLSNHIGWRYSFILVGVFTLILAGLVWLFVRNRPADMGWPSPSQTPSAGLPAIGLMEGLRKVVTHLWFWPLALWFFFDCAIFFAFAGLWGGPYLTQVYGLSKTQAGHVLSMLAVGMIVGSPLQSYFSNNVFKARKPVLVLSSFITLGLTASLAFYTDKIPLLGLYFLCLGLGMFSSAVVVIGFTAAKELFPVQIAGTATGVVNLFPFAGGAVSQPVLGFLLERQGRIDDAFTLAGYQDAFMALFLSGILTVLTSLFIKETMIPD